MAGHFGIALHGGAGVHPERDYTRVEVHLAELISRCVKQLEAGEAAIDVVEGAVAALEESGLYVAGRGAAPNTCGEVECDAAIMDGYTGRAGGVCALQEIAYPVRAARAVMDHTPYVLLAGRGARDFALAQNCQRIIDPKTHFCLPVGVEKAELERLDAGLVHGTVGAVALDRTGRLAAATSTGGLLGKQAGRVGDTPITGIGNWADRQVAISCTGIGEAFIKAGGARDVVSRMRYGGQSLSQAANAMLTDVASHNADGGLIAIDQQGQIQMAFNSPGMKRAMAGSQIPLTVAMR